MNNKLLGDAWGFRIPKVPEKDEALLLPYQQIGVEIEIETDKKWSQKNYESFSDILAAQNYWTIKPEGSIRNGFEIVMQRPLFGKQLTSAIDDIYLVLNKLPFTTSTRTGIHVHLDISDMLLEQFIKMCAAYALVEPHLFLWEGNNRQDNVFCVPWWQSTVAADLLKDLYRGTSPIDNSHINRQRYKYSALNLCSLSKFCTVEFRHLRTSLDKNRLLEWISFIFTLKQIGLSSTDFKTETDKLIATINKTPINNIKITPRIFRQAYLLSMEINNIKNTVYKPLFKLRGYDKKNSLLVNFLEKQKRKA